MTRKSIVISIISSVLSFLFTKFICNLSYADGWIYWVVFLGAYFVIDAIIEGIEVTVTTKETTVITEHKPKKDIDLSKIENINVATGVSNKNYDIVDVKQVDNHLYINGEEVRAIRFKDGKYKTIGQIIK